MPSVVSGYYEGPPADLDDLPVKGIADRTRGRLTVDQVRAYASAFLEAQDVPQRLIARAFGINRITHYRRVKRAAKYAVDAEMRTEGRDRD